MGALALLSLMAFQEPSPLSNPFEGREEEVIRWLEAQGFTRRRRGSDAGITFIGSYFVRQGMHVLEGKHVLQPGFNGLARWALPLALGWAAVELVTDRSTFRDVALSMGAYATAGVGINALADAAIYPLLLRVGTPGAVISTVYIVAKAAGAVALGHKIEELLRAAFPPRRVQSQDAGILRLLEGLGS